MQRAGKNSAIRLAHEVLGNGAVVNSYAIWRDPDNPDTITMVGKVRRYGILPRCHDQVIELYWVAQHKAGIQPWELISSSTPETPYVVVGGSGVGVSWSEPPTSFGPQHGLLRVPTSTQVITMTGSHHVVVSRQLPDGVWHGENLFHHPLVEYHLTVESESLILVQPFQNIFDHERRSLAIVSDVVEHCPLNAWHEGVPYHTHRLTA